MKNFNPDNEKLTFEKPEPVPEPPEETPEEVAERKVRDKAKAMGIKNYWNKKFESLVQEIQEIEESEEEGESFDSDDLTEESVSDEE